MTVSRPSFAVRSTRNVRGWNPTFLPSLGFWYDPSNAGSVTLNGSNVSQLNDLSGNGRHATQSTAANQPPYATAALNGLNCLNFGTSQNNRFLSWSAGSAVSNWREVFIVCRYDRATTALGFEGVLTGSANTNDDIGFIFWGSGSLNFSSGGSQSIWDFLTINGGIASNTVSSGTGSSWPVLPAINSLSVLQAWNTSQQLCNGVCIGSDRGNSGRGWMGVIGETFASQVTLTNFQRATAINYLMAKWGVA